VDGQEHLPLRPAVVGARLRAHLVEGDPVGQQTQLRSGRLRQPRDAVEPEVPRRWWWPWSGRGSARR
ncbi:hypothetical protein KVF89_26025, partial [Nocardioides carbamazepini]|uniref:hypothetical protein n=1 Tax=Nocardioides carbamazepini TaxID=2854259 RepID=UPI00214A62E9